MDKDLLFYSIMGAFLFGVFVGIFLIRLVHSGQERGLSIVDLPDGQQYLVSKSADDIWYVRELIRQRRLLVQGREGD